MKRKCLAIGIILLFVGIACSSGINADNKTKTELNTGVPELVILGIEGLVEYHGEPTVFGYWRLYVSVINYGDSTNWYSADGYIYRISRPNANYSYGYATQGTPLWENGQKRTINTIQFPQTSSFLPGKFHIHLVIHGAGQENYNRCIIDGNYFIFLNFIYPKYPKFQLSN